MSSEVGTRQHWSSITRQIPDSFRLHQNHPNPFNPSTTIGYEVPVQTHVMLRVYDVLGREVATLVNETKQAGSYTPQWDASGVSSGVYFCRLEARPTTSEGRGQGGSFTSVKKLLLLR